MATAKSIGFIGCGNMGSAIVTGLIADGFDPINIFCTTRSEASAKRLHDNLGITILENNEELCRKTEVIVMAVKPQMMRDVLAPLTPILRERLPLLVSIAAGLKVDHFTRWVGADIPVVRVMPNTPTKLQEGASGMYANKFCSQEQREMAENLMKGTGICVWAKEEKEMDVITALAGSGPAYFFLIMEAFQNAAQDLGLEPETAQLLCQQTVLGASRMAMDSDEDVSVLRKRVTSAKGTTECGVAALEKAGIREAAQKTLEAAKTRSEELAAQLV